MTTISRRGFLTALAAAPLTTLPEINLWVPRKRIFLPPRQGWPLARSAHVFLEGAQFSLEGRTRTLYGVEQFPVLFAPDQMRVLAEGRLRSLPARWREENALLSLDNKVGGVLLFPDMKFRLLRWETRFGEDFARVVLEQVR